ncbi:hypothetical protein TrRE_jg10611 [Triparma retinervis]|uniref:Uncharacterized protein n=1 Tax=Triparma retinervis TaxID=2557542 RepID=A0A9W7FI31_9STRA|nr:hypothetical protein TrRE_jg10611 [Triparma retinervis]
MISLFDEEEGKEKKMDVTDDVLKAIVDAQEHSEPRVRTLAATLLSKLFSFSSSPSTLFATIFPSVWSGIQDNYNTKREVPDLKTDLAADPAAPKIKNVEGLALDDTSGWRNLETSLVCYDNIVKGLGHTFFQPGTSDADVTAFLNDSNLDVLAYCATLHINRHVRAASMALLTTICLLAESSPTPCPEKFFNKMLKVLQGSLSDNWSQVRMASSVLCRAYLSALPPTLRLAADKVLIPFMSLNRFYLAEGVRLYSQETWKRMVPNGKEVLEKHLPKVIRHYVKALDEDNHVVRESAALAIGEIVEKISQEKVDPHLQLITESVKAAFYDESWPVRDRACVCLSLIGKRWGVEDEVWELIKNNLKDQIWSVRENAAWGMVQCLEKRPEKLESLILHFKKDVGSAKAEPKRTKKDVEQQANDLERHRNQQLYSCGSLAPKLHKSANRVAGCSDCMITRPTRVWEISDGCAYLLLHMAAERKVDDTEIVRMMELAVESTRHEEYVEHESLKATILKVFNKIVETRDKKELKRHYCSFFIRYTVQWCGAGGSGDGLGNLMMFEGERCMRAIKAMLGDAIFWGRVEENCEEELYWEDATGNPRRSLHADAGRRPALLSEEQKWEAQNTVAFWAATFFLQGSLLFTIGSIALYPSVLTVCSEDTKTEDCSPEFMYLAWVDYSFLIGAWCFTIGNYLVYFQVINSDKSSSEPFSLFARPVMDGGHLGAIFNLIGSLLFNWNTMLMFDTANHDSVWYEYNLVYVMSGGLGSVFFALGAIAEGEHNDWRDIKNLKKPEIQMAILNFVGSILFLLAYLTDRTSASATHAMSSVDRTFASTGSSRS